MGGDGLERKDNPPNLVGGSGWEGEDVAGRTWMVTKQAQLSS